MSAMISIAEVPEYIRRAERNELARLVDILVEAWIAR
jgi:hypothetical protein